MNIPVLLIEALRKPLQGPCHHLGALILETDFLPVSPASQRVRKRLEEMRALCRKLCASYDHLRSEVGELEIEQGVENPQFWVDPELREGCDPLKCQQNEAWGMGATGVGPGQPTTAVVTRRAGPTKERE